MAAKKDKSTEAAIVRQHRAKDHRKVAKQVGSGVRDMQIDPKLFANGLRYGREHGVDNIWNEPNAVDEIKKRHPEVVVGSGRSGVLSAPLGCHPSRSDLFKTRRRAPSAAHACFLNKARKLVSR